MPIAAGDIDFFLSGGAGNSDVNASLGGVKSTATQITTASLHNLFDIVSSAEASAGDTEYRCIYVVNSHGSLTLQSTVVWFSTDSSGADTDPAMALAGEGLNTTTETVADENTAPVGESFTTPTTEGGGLSMGNIPATQFYGLWIRRTVTAAASAASGLSFIITVKGDTAA